MSRLRAAVVGCGVIGRTHYDALRADGRADLVALCDLDTERCRNLDGDLAAVADANEIFGDPTIDLVCIGTPHLSHRALLEAAVGGGKHVFQEKPLATTPADIDAMVAAGERGGSAGLSVTCVFQHRFAPLAECLKSALDAGDFGAVLRGEFRFACTRNRAYYSREAWRGRWPTEGGGLLINQAIHGLDLALWFCGRPRRVEATVGCLRMSDCIEVEDVARGTVFCEGDIPVVVDAINDGETGWSNTVIIEAEKGSFTYTNDGGGRLLAIEHADAGLVARLEGLDASRQEVTAFGGKSEYGNYHLKQLSELIDAIEAGRPPRVTIAEGAWANRAVLGFYHATAIGGPADLSTFAADYQQPDLLSQAVPH